MYNLAENKVIYSVYFGNVYIIYNSNIVVAIVTKEKTFFKLL